MFVVSFINFIVLNNVETEHIQLTIFRTAYLMVLVSYLYLTWVYFTLIRVSGDIEVNQGPKFKSIQNFSLCY